MFPGWVKELYGSTNSDVFYGLQRAGLIYEKLAKRVKLEQLVMGPFTDE